MAESEPHTCPSCDSKKVYLDGKRVLSDGSECQRFLCRSCGYRFSEGHNDSKAVPGIHGNSQVCVFLQEAKNLTEPPQEKELAGDKKQQGSILQFAWNLKKRGLAEITIEQRSYWLNRIVKKGADLNNVDSVETVLATENFTPGVKFEIVRAYQSYTKTMNIPWIPIKVKHENRQVFIPLETEINDLIAGCGKRTSTFLQILKDTGARSGEIAKLQWTDVNTENSTIAINNPEKGSSSRTVKVSPKTIAMIKAMSTKYGKYIFNPDKHGLATSFNHTRKNLAEKLKNPRLLQIHFHTLRHWRGTMEYHRTRDILHVKRLLGHKRIENTELYTHLIEFENEEYHSATAKNLTEARQLIESGFEYVTEMDNVKLFRKRK